MKVVVGFFVLLFILGAVYGLAFFGIIPAQKIANKNPALMPILKAMHLAKPKAKVKLAAVAAPAHADDPIKKLAKDRAKLDEDRAALEQERGQFEMDKSKASLTASQPIATEDNLHDKVMSIYATMSPDDIAKILEQFLSPDKKGATPDTKTVLQFLTSLDEKKAGKVLAALPPAEAAELSRIMATQKRTPSAPQPHPAAYVQ